MNGHRSVGGQHELKTRSCFPKISPDYIWRLSSVIRFSSFPYRGGQASLEKPPRCWRHRARLRWSMATCRTLFGFVHCRRHSRKRLKSFCLRSRTQRLDLMKKCGLLFPGADLVSHRPSYIFLSFLTKPVSWEWPHPAASWPALHKLSVPLHPTSQCADSFGPSLCDNLEGWVVTFPVVALPWVVEQWNSRWGYCGMVLQIHSNTTLDDLTLNQSDLRMFINKMVNLHCIEMEPCGKKGVLRSVYIMLP